MSRQEAYVVDHGRPGFIAPVVVSLEDGAYVEVDRSVGSGPVYRATDSRLTGTGAMAVAETHAYRRVLFTAEADARAYEERRLTQAAAELRDRAERLLAKAQELRG